MEYVFGTGPEIQVKFQFRHFFVKKIKILGFLFSGDGETDKDTISETSYGNISAHTKNEIKIISYKAVDRKVHPQITGMHNEPKIEAGRRLLPVHTFFHEPIYHYIRVNKHLWPQ